MVIYNRLLKVIFQWSKSQHINTRDPDNPTGNWFHALCNLSLSISITYVVQSTFTNVGVTTSFASAVNWNSNFQLNATFDQSIDKAYAYDIGWIHLGS